MKNFDPIDIQENELDNLLRQFVLEGGDDEFTQNTLDMNADFLFSNTEKISPNTARELAMIQKLEQAFIDSSNWRKFLPGIILFFLLFTLGGAIYKNTSSDQEIISQNQNGGDNNSFVPSLGTDTSQAKQNATPTNSFSLDSSSTVIVDSLFDADTTQEIKTSPKEHFTNPNDHIQIEKNWYAGNDGDTNVANNTPGPIFSAKASPENYKLLQGNFNPRCENVMFAFKPDSFTTSYYKGEPFKSGMGDMQYFNFGEYAQRSQVEAENPDLRIVTTIGRWILPWAMLEYADTNDAKVETTIRPLAHDTLSFTVMNLYKIPQKGIQLAMNPFYFRKYEVTNKEYREFMNWVRAANGYANKQVFSCEIDTVEVTNPNDKENVHVAANGKRYRLKSKIIYLEDYNDVYNYVFFNKNSDAIKQLGKNSLYVYPDTLSWVNDFTFSYNEPMTNMYFWHPAYDNYPVVGVSWYQAMAFLDWKTHFHQKQLDAEHIPYVIEYTLPTDMEWELASISMMVGKNVCFNNFYESTQDWMTNLGISYSGHDDPYQRPNYLKNLFTKDEYFRGDYIEDGWFHTGPADLSHEKITDKDKGTKHLDGMGISWMDGNVSEWMMETYAQNWKPFFQKHLAVLDADKSESTQLAKQIEMLYDKGNAANGRLVRGGNWYDERFSGRPYSDRNEAGISLKRYIDPSEKHSTIGFRYVIHVKKVMM